MVVVAQQERHVIVILYIIIKMPLIKPRKGASKKTKRKAASTNISREIRAGVPRKQAIARGLGAAGLGRKKKTKKSKK